MVICHHLAAMDSGYKGHDFLSFSQEKWKRKSFVTAGETWLVNISLASAEKIVHLAVSPRKGIAYRALSLFQHIPARGCISFPLSHRRLCVDRDVSNEEFFVRDPAVDISFERNVCRLAIGSDPMSRWGRCRRRAHMKEKERARRQDIFQPSSPLTTAQFSFFVL